MIDTIKNVTIRVLTSVVIYIKLQFILTLRLRYLNFIMETFPIPTFSILLLLYKIAINCHNIMKHYSSYIINILIIHLKIFTRCCLCIFVGTVKFYQVRTFDIN